MRFIDKLVSKLPDWSLIAIPIALVSGGLAATIAASFDPDVKHTPSVDNRILDADGDVIAYWFDFEGHRYLHGRSILHAASCSNSVHRTPLTP